MSKKYKETCTIKLVYLPFSLFFFHKVRSELERQSWSHYITDILVSNMRSQITAALREQRLNYIIARYVNGVSAHEFCIVALRQLVGDNSVLWTFAGFREVVFEECAKLDATITEAEKAEVIARYRRASESGGGEG